MERKKHLKVALVCLLVVSFTLPVLASAQQPRSRRGGLYGDWQITIKLGVGLEKILTEQILSFSRNQEGQYTGQWITFVEMDELKDVKFEDNKLSFTRVRQNREGQSRNSRFTGTIEQDELSGLLIAVRSKREMEIEGKRAPRIPRGVGSWEMKIKAGERELTGTLTITADKEGNLSGMWKSSRGESKVSDLKYEDSKLTFKRVIQREEREWEMIFEGNVSYNSLEGVFKSDRGETPTEGRRFGASLIGTWDLDIESGRGAKKQRLKVNPDMSALYGTTLIKKINLDGNKVSFKYVQKIIGDRGEETSFEGKVAGSKLTGKAITTRGGYVLHFGDWEHEKNSEGKIIDSKLKAEVRTPGYTSKVTGTKRTFRRSSSRGSQQVTGRKIRRTSARQKSGQIKKKLRKPDILYIPTPQEVVDKMLEMAEIKEGDVVYDLGCGDGRIVVTAAKRYGVKAVGFDINPKRVRESLENVRKNNVEHLVTIKHEDVFTLDLRQANVVTLYLLPSLNVKLMPQLEKLRPGSRILSHDFNMRGAKPIEVYRMNSSGNSNGDNDGEYYGEEQHTIYKWIVPWDKD